MKQAKIFVPPESPKINYPQKKQFIEIEHFEIYESKGNHIELTKKEISSFRHREVENELPEYTPKQFINAVKEEMKYLGFTIEEVARTIYIKPERLKSLLQGKIPFKKEETIEIKKKLNID